MRLTFERPHAGPQLLDELLAAVPALAPVDGVAVVTLTSGSKPSGDTPKAVWIADADAVTIDIDDTVDVDEKAVAKVVNAHVPKPPGPPGPSLLPPHPAAVAAAAAASVHAVIPFLAPAATPADVDGATAAAQTAALAALEEHAAAQAAGRDPKPVREIVAALEPPRRPGKRRR